MSRWIFSQPTEITPLGDPKEVRRKYRYWRIRTLTTLFLGYAIFYFVRKNLSAATPALLRDLALSKTQMGTITSGLYLTYGFGKFFNGIIGDRSNPRVFMSVGLLFSALMNICFGLSSSFFALAIFWALNGWFQSMGWPSCARSLTHWFSTQERGIYWGIWNASHQVGGALILALAGALTAHFGWRSALFIPSGIALAASVFIFVRLRDTPRSLGLPEIEEFQGTSLAKSEERAQVHKLSTREILLKHVLNQKEIWLLTLGNFFVYIVRYGAMDWAPTFLVEQKDSAIASAGLKVSGFELTGIMGALIAGYASDHWYKGKRAPLNVLYMSILVLGLILFWKTPAGHPIIDALALAAMGFTVYGPQMLVGVAAADLVSPRAAATATGLTGVGGYLGGIVSGVGAGWIVDRYGWSGGFTFFAICAALGAVCFAFTAGRGGRHSEHAIHAFTKSM